MEADRLREDVDKFCRELRPIEDLAYLERKHNDMLIPLAKKYNLLGMIVSRDYGGRDADNITYIKALERIGMEGSGIRSFFSVHTSLAQRLLMRYGSEEQKERYLKPSARGDKIFAFALTEPDAGSNPLEMKTTYHSVEDVDGHYYLLNGTKYLITNATIADAIIVFAKDSSNSMRMSAFIVDADREGIEREPLVAKMGTPTTDTGMFELKDYKVPRGNLIGKEGEGWKIAKEALIDGRLSVAAGCVGSIKDCLIEAVRYAKERVQYGKPIGKHQLVQEHIAMIELDYKAARSMVRHALLMKERWDREPGDEVKKRAADLAVAEAKLFAVNAAYDAADRALQIYGGRGWSYLYRPARHLVDNRVCRIYEGTDEILKLKIASSLLGKDYRAYG
ncbi:MULTISPECIES: acyl-CoA dehydrogenase family protein [Candidatus Nitrosocaldus]|uniref:Short-chain specific acyl-CoA dehydrogenase n=1 Tax=Candidatus Nitrosocaldus cavascurensis TaxID=2058097 RepID=A0A2K5AQG3_9ARCH|nr:MULTISPECIES: acyl-CoA dehydrogenase family protein [Candidatus Nitrosocaldus]SPC33847.1 short-chain specific acyl-CoA dehydrogenase [Candidatus Nitrosocaldus cavascurensis]